METAQRGARPGICRMFALRSTKMYRSDSARRRGNSARGGIYIAISPIYITLLYSKTPVVELTVPAVSAVPATIF